MSKRTETRLFEVSGEYRSDIGEEVMAIVKAIGVENPAYPKKNEVRIEVRYQASVATFYDCRRVSGVRLSVFLHTRRDYVRRLVNVKEGFLDLNEIDKNIAELSRVKIYDDQRHEQIQADLERSQIADQAIRENAEAVGLRVSAIPLDQSADHKICLWGVSNQRLVLQQHPGLSIDQAIAVQNLINSFAEKEN